MVRHDDGSGTRVVLGEMVTIFSTLARGYVAWTGSRNSFRVMKWVYSSSDTIGLTSTALHQLRWLRYFNSCPRSIVCVRACIGLFRVST